MVKIKMKKETEENGTKKPGFFSKIVYLWVLPIVYTIGLAIIIIHIAGTSISDQMKWVNDRTDKIFSSKESTTKKTPNTRAKNNSETEINNEKNKPVENQVPIPTENSQANNATNSYSVAETFSNIEPRDAAELLNNMKEADALKVLKELNVDIRDPIIAEMPEDAAARFTNALVNGSDFETTTYSSSQLYQYMKPDQIAEVLKGIENNEEVLRQIQQLDPMKASEVISELDPEVAGWIITRTN